VCEDAVSAHLFGQKVVSYLLKGGWGLPPPAQEIVDGALARTGLLGYSKGGLTAAYAASQTFGKHKMRNGVLALMNTAADFFETVAARNSYARFLVPSWLLVPRLNNLAVVAQPYPQLKLIGHSDRDEIVSLSHGKRLRESAGGASRLFVFRNCGHFDMCEKDPETFTQFSDAIYDALTRV
jgi:pimeloyl-ACP methyl ester carboxylesterase